MTEYQIIDLDGCIANDLWRRPFIRPLAEGEQPNAERFFQYHEASALDSAANLEHLHPTARKIVLTARPMAYYAATMDWLRHIHLDVEHIIMRNNHDHRTSLDLKREMVLWLQAHYGVPLNSIVQAIDDRDDIVAMYRDVYGLPARVVRIGEEASL